MQLIIERVRVRMISTNKVCELFGNQHSIERTSFNGALKKKKRAFYLK